MSNNVYCYISLRNDFSDEELKENCLNYINTYRLDVINCDDAYIIKELSNNFLENLKFCYLDDPNYSNSPMI